jgi:anti-sigma-K factor RskA
MNDQEYNGLTHDQILEMLPAFVVGALAPDEMLEVEEYIHAYPELMARVHELELAAAKLAYSAPAQQLPMDLHAAVMNRARASLPPRPQPAAPVAVTRQPARPVRTAVRENPLVEWWRKRAFWDLGLVAAAAAALLLGIFYRDALVEVGDLRRQVQGLEQEVATLQNENVRLQSELDTRLNQLASIAGAQQIVALGGTESAPGASGTLYVQDRSGTLVLNNLEPLGEDQVYQLWLIPPDGAPIPAGLLGQVAEQTAMITLDLPATLENIAAVGVSIEPPGGSAEPTGPIVLLGERA